ncbi:MAG: beta-lactamase family protein [Gammaproteobacteria bacterium]|jgi:CubicO group peptidase (beta-lactamase class C family)|nr:beta-lactamase family protein [Gammaproteobacteria bacterium]MBT5601496.1 beta-lactamase family protein [Gammaproteobacteria bacterium]MBT6246602.1 beta-lactamase family protein [Gammaproteobacteria bacterium]
MKHAKQELHDPAELGIDPDKLGILKDRIQQDIDSGLLPSAQFAIARRGKLVAFETFGAGTPDSLYCVFSSTKAITSALAWLLIQEDNLDTASLVSDYLPEFCDHGKQAITIEQLFTHTAGLPHAPFHPLDWLDQEKRRQRFQSWRLNWQPGSRFEYHPTSSMWVIAAIIEAVNGESFSQQIRTRIAEPLALKDLYLGCPASEHHRIERIQHVGEAMTAADFAALNLPEPPVTEVTEDALTRFNDSNVRKIPIPGGGGIMSAAELALFYQALIGFQGSSERWQDVPWQPSTIQQATQIRTQHLLDPYSGIPVLRGLGVVIAGETQSNLRGFGHNNSASSFGHGGAGGQIAWVDPETELSFAFCTNGHDRNPIRQGRRGVSLSNRAVACAALGD